MDDDAKEINEDDNADMDSGGGDNISVASNDNATSDIMVAALVPKIHTVTLAAPLAGNDTSAVTDTPASAAANFEMPPLALVDVSEQPLMGSSRISGGFLRGRSHGNVPKHADFTTTPEPGRPIKGDVCLYVMDQYPRHVKFESLKGESDMVVMVEVVESMALILEKVARKFSIIQSECPSYLFKSLNLKFYSDQDYHIYYRKSMKWIALGSFDQAVEDDDECEWGISDENTPELHLLIVSLHSMFTFCDLIFLLRVLTMALLRDPTTFHPRFPGPPPPSHSNQISACYPHAKSKS